MSAGGNGQRQCLFPILSILRLRLPLTVFVPLQEEKLHPKMHLGMGQVSDLAGEIGHT